MSDVRNVDEVIEALGSCGLFQVLFTVLVYAPQIATSFGSIFMSFGSYNPGWICLDHLYANDNITTTNSSYTTATTGTTFDGITIVSWSGDVSYNYSGGLLGPTTMVAHDNNQTSSYHVIDNSCHAFKACANVQFNPGTSTIVTEWGLVCDKSWVISLIISLQMIGSLVGALLVAYIGDRFGRKVTLYSGILLNALMLFASIFSSSWQMLATLRFGVGITDGIVSTLPLVYITEFISQKWRSVVASLPTWTVGIAMFSFAAMGLKDWRQLHIINMIITAVIFLPVFWVPESLRWLMVKGKDQAAIRVAQKMSRFNKTTVPPDISQVAAELNGVVGDKQESKESHFGDDKGSSFFFLFRKNAIVKTLVIGVVRFSNDLIYFVTSFGVVGMPGNFYINLIIISITYLPGSIFSSFVPNVFGRKSTLVASFQLMTLSLIGVVVVDLLVTSSAKPVATLVLIVIARLFQKVNFSTSIVFVNELYPTVSRSSASGYASFMGGLGSILAPYLIPGTSVLLFVSYAVMAVLSFICGLLLMLLPETKGRHLPDVWQEEMPIVTSLQSGEALTKEHGRADLPILSSPPLE